MNGTCWIVPPLQNMKGVKGTVHSITCHEGQEGEQRYSSTLSLTSALDGGGWLKPHPVALPPGNRPGTHCIGGWVGPRASLDRYRKSHPTGIWSPDCPARSESSHWLYSPRHEGSSRSSRLLSHTSHLEELKISLHLLHWPSFCITIYRKDFLEWTNIWPTKLYGLNK